MIFQSLKQTSLALILFTFFATAAQAQMRASVHQSLDYGRVIDEGSTETGPDFEAEMFIPNAFTPNADGINDTFGPIFEGEANDYSLVIFDRYGRLVFSADNMRTQWDGTMRGKQLHDGVYIYGISYLDPSGEKQTRSGSITLLR